MNQFLITDGQVRAIIDHLKKERYELVEPVARMLLSLTQMPLEAPKCSSGCKAEGAGEAELKKDSVKKVKKS